MSATDKSKGAEFLCYCDHCKDKLIVQYPRETAFPSRCPTCGSVSKFAVDKKRTTKRKF